MVEKHPVLRWVQSPHDKMDIGAAAPAEIKGQLMRAHEVLLVQYSLPIPAPGRPIAAQCGPKVPLFMIWIKGRYWPNLASNQRRSKTGIQEPSAMPDSIDDLIPNATKIRQEAALQEAEKAPEYARNRCSVVSS